MPGHNNKTINSNSPLKDFIERMEILCYNYSDNYSAREVTAWTIPLFLQDLNY